MRITCPVCDQLFQVPDAAAGKKTRCCKCGQKLMVPRSSESRSSMCRVSLSDSNLPSDKKNSSTAPSKSLTNGFLKECWETAKSPFEFALQSGVCLFAVARSRIDDRNNERKSTDQLRNLIWRKDNTQWRRIIIGTLGTCVLLAVMASTVIWLGGMPFAKSKSSLISTNHDLSDRLLTKTKDNKESKSPKSTPPTVGELTSEQVVAQAEKSVALIKTPISFGTGFIAAPGILVTNAHVIESSAYQDLKIYFPTEKQRQSLAVEHVLHCETNRDLAILELNCQMPSLKLVDNYTLRKGQTIIAIGNPGLGRGKFTLQNAVSKGIVSTEVELAGGRLYQLNISVNGGNSGGPVLDSKGQVIGVIQSKAIFEEGVAFCIPVDEVQSAIRKTGNFSQSTKAKNDSYHNARAVFRRIGQAGIVYVLGNKEILAKWQSMFRRYGNVLPSDITSAQRSFLAKLKKQNFDQMLVIEDVRDALTKIGTDSNLPESTRQDLAKLWTAYRALESYFKTPRGSLTTYGNSIQKYSDQFFDQIDTLTVTLGIPRKELDPK